MTTSAITEITAESASRYADTKPYRIHYYEAGEGYPIVFLHGSGPAPPVGAASRPTLPRSRRRITCTRSTCQAGPKATPTDEQGRDQTAQLIAFSMSWASSAPRSWATRWVAPSRSRRPSPIPNVSATSS